MSLPQTVTLDWDNSHGRSLPQIGDKVGLTRPLYGRSGRPFVSGTVVGYRGLLYSNRRTEPGTRYFLCPLIDPGDGQAVAATPNEILLGGLEAQEFLSVIAEAIREERNAVPLLAACESWGHRRLENVVQAIREHVRLARGGEAAEAFATAAGFPVKLDPPEAQRDR